MALRLIALDPGTTGDDCPAVFIDTDTGDLVYQGPVVADPADLAEMNAVSRMRPGEAAVRLPERMRGVILRALQEVDGGQLGADPTR